MSEKKKIEGLKTWINPKNGFACVQLHYTADPCKRSKEWKEKASYGMPNKAWRTEMELCWETYTGDPVFGQEFNARLHVLDEEVLPNPDVPILFRGWDFGGNHSCAIAQYLDGRLTVLKEYANVGFNTRRIAQEIIEDCGITFGDSYQFVDIIDPSGYHEGKTSTGKACADVMHELGMNVQPGVQDPSRRIDAIMKLLITLRDGRPCLQLNPSCKWLIKGFEGGYHYPEKEKANQKMNRPEKNEYSHIMDALAYVCTRLGTYSLMSSTVMQSFEDDGYVYKF